MQEVMLMIGTRKGGFLAFADPSRKNWKLTGPFVKGTEVNYVTYLGEGKPTVFAAATSAWWGTRLQISHDFGKSWEEPSNNISFAEGRGMTVERIWVVESGLAIGTVYAGIDPASLFRSQDGGNTWDEVKTVVDHPTRKDWQPGAGGMMVHSICIDPGNTQRMFLGISAAGVFRSDDAGKTWHPKNKGVRADFHPDTFPIVGQCTHRLAMHSSQPEILYQQNHCGVYRSENAGDSWTDISDGLPCRFGFPMAVHPHDGDCIYVVPEESDQYRVTPGGKFCVYRSKNRGDSWEALADGLPQSNAYQNVLRAAMSTDDLDPPGVYVGTQGGQILASYDAGDHWTLAFNWLPPIYSIQAAVVER